MKFLPSRMQLQVMDLLRQHPDSYALALVQHSSNKLKKGTVYVTLHRLVEDGMVTSKTPSHKTKHPGLPRPRYSLTKDGETTLDALRGLSRVRGM